MNYINTKGVATWNIAQKLIVGGTGLLSKRPTRYSGAKWPCYYEKASGIKIKSIDGIWFKDFSEFSIGCNLLGYAPRSHSKIVSHYRNSSPLSSLCSRYEPELASKLNKFLDRKLSWKFCRGGGEALSVAVRFARTFSKNKKILVCGYHGFHDWYLASNLNSNNSLDGIFLEGLSIKGIPEEYKDTTSAIKDLSKEALLNSIDKFNPGIIVFESARYEKLGDDFCHILKTFQENGGILISDEVTSGFRFKNKLACYQIEIDPEIIVLGKSLGTGYAISAVGIHNKFHMKAQDCFLSSTHWTEEIGFKAGIKTIDEFTNWNKFFEKLSKNADYLKDSIESTFLEEDLNFTINNISTMIKFSASYGDLKNNEFLAILNYRMLKRKYLISSTIYPTIKHSIREINLFKKNLKKCITSIKLDYKNNFEDLKLELARLGKLEQGFARTQKL